jgi:hypothetical protein
MPYTGIKSQWEDGDLVFYANDGTEIARFDEGNSALDIATFFIDNTEVTATAAELNNAADVSDRVQEVTSDSTDIDEGKQSVEFNEDGTSSVGATIADASNHQGIFIVKDVSNDNTQDHTLTLTAGTFDGSNNVATLDAAGEALVVYFDSEGDGVILENIGTVGLS